MELLRFAGRALGITGHFLVGVVITALLVSLRRLGVDKPALPPIVQWWHRRACRLLGLELRVAGALLEGPALLVANHVSWLDIPVLGALQPMAFLSKSEVRAWPLLGWMAEFVGTLFIARGSHQSALIRDLIQRRLDAGEKVVFFPEGTTTDGSDVRRFHPRLFAAVQQTGARVQPVSLRYLPAPGRKPVAPFIGDDDLPSHLLRVLREPAIVVEIAFLRPLRPGDQDRKTLAQRARASIRESLGLGAEGPAGDPAPGRRPPQCSAAGRGEPSSSNPG